MNRLVPDLHLKDLTKTKSGSRPRWLQPPGGLDETEAATHIIRVLQLVGSLWF
jgi:hypothetical protein